ncbi:MAG TPA: diguanylate cyclase [Thiobacillus sp.]
MKTNHPVPLSNVMDLLLDAICVVDTRGCFVFVSAACERIFGYTPEEMIGRPMIDFVFPEDRPRTLQQADDIVAGCPQPHFENRYVRKDGKVVHIMWSARWSEADQVRVAVARDVTERKRADSMQAALYAISEAAHWGEDLVTLFQQIHQILGGLLPAVNFFVALYDENKDELSFPYYVDEYDQAPAPQKLDSTALSAEVIRTGHVLLLAHDAGGAPTGYARPDMGRGAMNWLGVPLNAKNGVIGALVVQSYSAEIRYTKEDVELLQFVATQIAPVIERKQMESWLQHIARHDPLTDLPNRELFHDRLQTSLNWAERNQTPLALLYLDLDKFKQVNDTLGHPVGDLLLQEVAHRLKQCVRESDTVGRVGGDEFLVLLHGIPQPEQALLVAEKIRVALAKPFDLAGHRVQVFPSIGVALYPDHSDDYKQLIRYADEAMYDAKKRGGNRYQITSRPGIQK